MLFLIKRRPDTSREELVAHWFANHMPGVIETQKAQAARGRNAAHRYIATLFDADKRGEHPLDGLAALWFDKPFPKPDRPYGTEPRDTFQQAVPAHKQTGQHAMHDLVVTDDHPTNLRSQRLISISELFSSLLEVVSHPVSLPALKSKSKIKLSAHA